MLTALALLAAAAQTGGEPAQSTAMATSDPVTVFKTVCQGGEVRLSKKMFAVASYDAMPADAKTALGFSLPAKGTPAVKPKALPASDVPNMIVATLPDRNAFLLLPAEGRGVAAQVCGVVWQGADYARARATAKELVPTPIELPAGEISVPGIDYTQLQGNGAIVGAAEYDGWTVLRLTPDPTTATPENRSE